MGMFKNEFGDIVRAAIVLYAKELNCPETDIQIMIYLDSGEDAYAIYNNSVFVKKVTLLNILNRKIDFTGLNLIVSHFLKKVLIRYADQFKIEKDKIRIMIIREGESKIILYLLNGADAIKVLNPEDILSDENYADASNEVMKQIEQ